MICLCLSDFTLYQISCLFFRNASNLIVTLNAVSCTRLMYNTHVKNIDRKQVNISM